MLNKHFLLTVVIAFALGVSCAPRADAMMHWWGSGSSGSGASDSSNGGTSGQGSAQDTGSSDEEGWPSNEDFAYEAPDNPQAPPPYSANEPIGEPVGSVPEPLTLVLFGAAATGLGVRQWRRRKHS